MNRNSETAPLMDLAQRLPFEQWAVYRAVLRMVIDSKIPFALGGAIALGAYTGRFRNTKDIDLYVLPENRDAIIAILNRAGLRDYFDECAYDRSWIYRATDGNAIVDVIWAMANRRAYVDQEWLSRGGEVTVDDMRIRVLPPEELIWSKLYVMQRERCDWPDILNLVHTTGGALDWDHLMRRVGDDAPLLKGVLSVFSWLCGESEYKLPKKVRNCLEEHSAVKSGRAELLDSRPWFNDPKTANGSGMPFEC